MVKRIEVKTIEEVKSLAHAYQEGEQPRDDKNYNYRWGEGFHKGVDFVISCIPDLIEQDRRERYTELRGKIEGLKCHETDEIDYTQNRIVDVVLSLLNSGDK